MVGGEGTEERGWGHFGGRVGRPEGDERREDGLTDFGSSAGSTRGGRYCWGGGEEDINRCFPFVLSDGSRTVRGVVCEERGWIPPQTAAFELAPERSQGVGNSLHHASDRTSSNHSLSSSDIASSTFYA